MNFSKLFFNSKYKSEHKNTSEIINMIISVDQNKQVDFTYKLTNLDDNNAEILAKLLYGLNKGYLLSLFIESLILEKTSDNKTQFINHVLDILNNYYEIDSSNEPIVKPSNTFTKNVK